MCRFCDIIKNNNDPSLICKTKYGSLFVSFNQYYTGRVLYIHNQHLADVTELPMDIWKDESNEVFIVCKIIKKLFNCDLINVASLGNHVEHLHWHIIPRYKTDVNWGNPPWPHDRKIVSLEDCRPIAIKIRTQLENEEEFKNLIIS